MSERAPISENNERVICYQDHVRFPIAPGIDRDGEICGQITPELGHIFYLIKYYHNGEVAMAALKRGQFKFLKPAEYKPNWAHFKPE